MLYPLVAVVLTSILGLPADPDGPRSDTQHRRNSVYADVLRDGLVIGEDVVRLPAPTFSDEMDDDARRTALQELCGSERAAADFLRDSVTAPQILKVRDSKTADAIVRSVDVWFAVRADLSRLDAMKLIAESDAKAVEVGNMRFENRLLTADELKPRNREARLDGEPLHGFVDLKGRLLDRIAFEAVDEVMATRTADSMIIAARVDRGFDAPAGSPLNHWKNLAENGPAEPFQGGVSYVKISRFDAKSPDVLLVEVHAAFAEPEAWFHGAPILRSKFAPVAQDQIRRLRRELLKARPRPTPP